MRNASKQAHILLMAWVRPLCAFMTSSRKPETIDVEPEDTASSAAENGNVHEEIHYSLLVYLKKLGYRQTESVFREEARSAGIETLAFELRAEQDSSLQPSILLPRRDEARIASGTGDSSAESAQGAQAAGDLGYEAMFSRLKKWVCDSLDIYRDELSGIMYPMFVHCFLDLIAKNMGPSGRKRG
jgi:hypothetical protein